MLKPFLKWAGGKYRVLPHILPELPVTGTYVEPFAGSAAVWLNVDCVKSVVCDKNADLISLYNFLKSEGESFIRYCASFFIPENNTQSAYYKFRGKFNGSDDARLRAALFVYLNRHCFNGLARFNAQGKFNTPFGRYKAPHFPCQEMRSFCEKSRHADFVCRDFRDVFQNLQPNDVVYCDPPYAPLSQTTNFTAYTGGGFSFADQEDLARLALEAVGRGVTVLISNHDTPETRELYAHARIIHFPVQRAISCKGNNRKAVPEILAVFRM